MGNDSPTSATGGLWRTLLIIWVTVMAGMDAVAVTWSQGGATALQIFGYGIPLLTAVLAFRGVRDTLRHKQTADDHAHWWDQTKWAFDLVMSPHATSDELRMAVRTLHRQAGTSGLPDGDLDVALDMVQRAIAKLGTLGRPQPVSYDETAERL